MLKKLLLGFTLFPFICFMHSCIVERPPFTKIENVLTLRLGMTKEEVSKVLDIPPYDIKALNDSGETILIYKYRVTNRKTLPFFVKPKNGFKVNGKYVDLFVTYNKEGKATKIESCSECSETEEKQTKLDVNKLITLISVLAPSLLVYLGIVKATQ